MNMQLIDLEKIRKSAQHSADECLGPQSNPHAEESEEFNVWIQAYYARIQTNSIECAA